MTAQLLSTGLVIETRAKILLPASIGRIMLSILGLMESEKLEYGLFLKGAWDPEALTVTVEDGVFYLPAQTVTSAHIEFTEQPPGPEWNVVIHRHPPGVTKFSGTDKGSINQEFLASLIFMPPWSFPDSVVNVPMAPGVKLQVEGSVRVLGAMFPEGDGLGGPVKEKIRSWKAPAQTAPAAPGTEGQMRLAATGSTGPKIGVPVPSGNKGATVTAVGPAPETREPRRGLVSPQGTVRRLRRLPGLPANGRGDAPQDPSELHMLREKASGPGWIDRVQWDDPARRRPPPEVLGLGAYASETGIHPDDVEEIREFLQQETDTRGVRVVNGGPTGHRQAEEGDDWIPRDVFYTR